MRAMTAVRLLFPLLLGVVSCAGVAGAGDPTPPRRLTHDTYEAIKARLILTPEDLAWRQVRWRDGFFEGLLEAQAADRPMFYWIYGGDPRGDC